MFQQNSWRLVTAASVKLNEDILVEACANVLVQRQKDKPAPSVSSGATGVWGDGSQGIKYSITTLIALRQHQQSQVLGAIQTQCKRQSCPAELKRLERQRKIYCFSLIGGNYGIKRLNDCI